LFATNLYYQLTRERAGRKEGRKMTMIDQRDKSVSKDVFKAKEGIDALYKHQRASSTQTNNNEAN
jgi:hypothetical protein